MVTLLEAAFSGQGVTVLPAWNPEATSDSVFIGRAIWDPSESDLTRIGHEYPTAETNVPKWESYPVQVSAWSFRSDLTPEAAATAVSRIFAMKATVDAVFADVDLDLGAGVSVRLGDAAVEKRAYTSGWACGVVTDINVRALLTT